jgi:hypothetical protein
MLRNIDGGLLVSTGAEDSGVPTINTKKCQNNFMTLSPVLLPEQSAMVLLLGMALVSWSLAIDERGTHEDLCGSDRRSVISYVHRRSGLYCSSLPCLCEPKPFSF